MIHINKPSMCRVSASKTLHIFHFISLCIILSTHLTFAAEISNKRSEILVIHSYSPDYSWTQTEQAGIDSVFRPLASQYKLRIEYMDTNHNPSISKGPLLQTLYKDKFSNSSFKAIIVSDNAALDFLKLNRDKLFPGTPVVFSGINGYEPSMTANFPSSTGVAEENDFSGLFDMIGRLHPKVGQVVIYGIASDPSHQANVALIKKSFKSLTTKLKFDIREFNDIESCIVDARKLSEYNVILMVGSMRTKGGEGINLQRANELMSPEVNVPIYSAWDFAINHGAVGGLVVSGYDQGRLAAELVLRILKGESADKIEVQRNVNNVYLFDYTQMTRFGINVDQLPTNSIILNRPESAYQFSKETTLAIAFSFSILCAAVIILGFNVRRRKRVEAELEASQEKYEKAFRNSADVIGIARLIDGSYIEVSEVFFRIFGFSREEVINMPSAATDEPDLTAGFKLWLSSQARTELFNSFHEQGYVKNLEVIWCTKKREQRIGLYSAEVISIGAEPCIIYVWHDITERKQAETHRLELEERLRLAHKMESIGLLAGGIAHDFNNLLTPILGYSEILLARIEADNPNRKALQQIREASERAAKLVQQLLAFSRKQMLELKQVDIGDVVNRFEQILRSSIREDIQIKCHLTSNLGVVLADTGQIEQVLMNLAVNAQDSMPNGGILTIETQNVMLDESYVTMHPEASTGPHVALIISDSGTGINKEALDHIFEPFFTTKESGKGTGLGLATVYGIVKQHGGSISVYSELERGTTFKVYLKCVSVSSTDINNLNQIQTEFSRGTETILVVEDNDLVRHLACEMLQLAGYNVLSADGGETALQVFKQHEGQVHLLLTDVIMPAMNGKEIAHRLCSAKPELKVLYMSGYTGNVIGQHGLLENDMHLIQKPLSLKTLSDKVRQVLDL
jgi:two-component system, cell cycle sensor histidine kinase and response regulator CckA